MPMRSVDCVTCRALADFPLQTAWLCGFRAASLQRFALVVTRQAIDLNCKFEQIPSARRAILSANAWTTKRKISDRAPSYLFSR